MRIDPNHVGKLTEVIVLKQLIKHGHQIAMPFGNQAMWDLLFSENGRWKSAQIKAATYNLSVSVHRLMAKITHKHVAYTAEDVDYIVIADLETECVWRYKTPLTQRWISPANKDIWLRGHCEPPVLPYQIKHGGNHCSSRKALAGVTERADWMTDRIWTMILMMQAGDPIKAIGRELKIRPDSAHDLVRRTIQRLQPNS